MKLWHRLNSFPTFNDLYILSRRWIGSPQFKCAKIGLFLWDRPFNGSRVPPFPSSPFFDSFSFSPNLERAALLSFCSDAKATCLLVQIMGGLSIKTTLRLGFHVATWSYSMVAVSGQQIHYLCLCRHAMLVSFYMQCGWKPMSIFENSHLLITRMINLP